MRKRLMALLQLALGVGLITFLFYRMDNKTDLLEALRAIASHPLYLTGAIFSFFACMLMCAWRWKLILSAHDIQLPFWKAMELFLIGQFFNAFMFGSVGGDLVKVFFVAKAIPHKQTEAVATVFIDRLMGLLSLIILIAVIMGLRYPFFMRYPQTRIFMIFMTGVLIATVGGLFLIFRKNVFEHWAFFRHLEERTPLGKMISKTYNAFHTCLRHKGLLFSTLTISMANHISIIIAALLLGLGLNIRTVHPTPEPDNALAESVALSPLGIIKEFGNYLTVFPIINGISAIPATPGGLGTREAAAEFLLGVPEFDVPSTRAIPLSLLLYATTLFWSLIGGGVYSLHSIRPKALAKPLKQ